MEERPRGVELVVVGDFNMELEKTVGRGRDKEIASAVAMEGLEDITGHLLLQWRVWCKDWRTWVMVRQGMVVRYQMDYIMGSYRQIFQNLAVRYLRHNSDHLMVIGCLRVSSLREHSRYLGRRMRLPLHLPGRHTRMRAYKIFS